MARVSGWVAIAALAVACGASRGDAGEPTVRTVGEALISDQAHHGGTRGFFFLPPIAPPASFGSPFVRGLAPVVVVEEMGGRGAIATFTRASPPGERLVETCDAYLAMWRTHGVARPGFVYRIRVLLDGVELGFADAQVVGNWRELLAALRAEVVPLLSLPLPIAFRIDAEAIPSRCAGVVCTPLDACHQSGTCDPTTGLCSQPPQPDGTPCDDGSAATVDDLCTAGHCAGTVPPGTVRWAVGGLGAIGKSSPALAPDGTVYLAADGAAATYSLWAVSPEGAPRWEYRVAGHIADSTPAVAEDGTIFVGAADKRLHAVGADGVPRWVLDLDDVVTNAPALGSDGTIYLGTGNPYLGTGQGALVAVDPAGTVRWVFSSPATSGGWSTPAIGRDGTIYAGSYDGRLHALGPDGTEHWATAIPTYWGQTPALGADGAVYVASSGAGLHAVEPDGTLRWVHPLGAAVVVEASPVIGPDGTVYVSTNDGQVHAIAADGTARWAAVVPGTIGLGLGADGTLYSGSWSDGELRALDSDTGALLWSVATLGAAAGSPAIGPEGVVLIGNWAGRLAAVQGGPGGPADSPWPLLGRDARRSGRAR